MASRAASAWRSEVGTLSCDRRAAPGHISLRDRGGMGSLQSQGSWEICSGPQSSWVMWGQAVGCARPLDVSGGQSKESDGARLQFCGLCPRRFPPLSPPPLLLILFLPCAFFSCLAESAPQYPALLLCPLALSAPVPRSHAHPAVHAFTPSPPCSCGRSPPFTALLTHTRLSPVCDLQRPWS